MAQKATKEVEQTAGSLCDICSGEGLFDQVEAKHHIVEEDGERIVCYECPECGDQWEDVCR